MSNLLPEEKKKELKVLYVIKLFIVSLLFLASAAFISIIVIASFSVLLHFEQKELNEELSVFEDVEIVENDLNTIKDLNTKLGILNIGTDKILPTEIIRRIIDRKGSAIRVNRISYVKNITEGIVTLSGVSDDRNSLLKFEKALEEEEIFTSVESPISSLSQSHDIDFTISINLQ